MHLELKLNEANTNIFFGLLDPLQQADIYACFNRLPGFFEVLQTNVLYHLSCKQIFNSCNITSSGPFALQFPVLSLIQHFKKLKKVSATINLTQKPQKSPELVFQFYSDDSYDSQQMVSQFILSVNLKKGNTFSSFEQDLKLFQDSVDKFSAENPVQFVLPKTFFQVLPLHTDDDFVKIFSESSNNKKHITFEQLQIQTEIIFEGNFVSKFIEVRTEEFLLMGQTSAQIKKCLGGSFGHLMSFTEELVVFTVKSEDQWCVIRVAARGNE
ncbi:Hypothetical_protein [Hexamita inflata]|uniref:Hypothetical_protein n=1 Tax=Hexamita inflata TaxID=28002 RepID=A0AA86RHQ1_9EUKA|nr:Hypothetical protein HINF_LOCUS64392 [Hexamita inflata]